MGTVLASKIAGDAAELLFDTDYDDFDLVEKMENFDKIYQNLFWIFV